MYFIILINLLVAFNFLKSPKRDEEVSKSQDDSLDSNVEKEIQNSIILDLIFSAGLEVDDVKNNNKLAYIIMKNNNSITKDDIEVFLKFMEIDNHKSANNETINLKKLDSKKIDHNCYIQKLKLNTDKKDSKELWEIPLFNYLNLEEREQDSQISTIIEDLSDAFRFAMSEDKKGKNLDFKIHLICNELSVNFEVSNFESILRNIYIRIQNEATELTVNLLSSFETECKERKISSELFNRRKFVLENKFLSISEDWKQVAKNKISGKKVMYSKAHFEIINKEIERSIIILESKLLI